MTDGPTRHALYRFYDADGQLLYVGITADPGSRWRKHAHDKPWWHDVANITIETHPTRADVLEAERAAILTEKPRHNIVHNRGTSEQPRPVPQLDRLSPIQPGDWIAAGLGDGRCPVGEVAAIDETWLSIRLKSFLWGGITNHVIAVRWSEIVRVELAYPEHAYDDDGQRTMDDEHLSWFQAGWKLVHLPDGDLVDNAAIRGRTEGRL